MVSRAPRLANATALVATDARLVQAEELAGYLSEHPAAALAFAEATR